MKHDNTFKKSLKVLCFSIFAIIELLGGLLARSGENRSETWQKLSPIELYEENCFSNTQLKN